jgi:hypothetical protein
MTKAEELFHSIADKTLGAVKGKMFGALSIKIDSGKGAVMFWKECMVFKLPADELKEALSWDGSHLFDPMGGRPMKEWVQVPFDYSDQWQHLANKSLEYVKTLKK